MLLIGAFICKLNAGTRLPNSFSAVLDLMYRLCQDFCLYETAVLGGRLTWLGRVSLCVDTWVMYEGARLARDIRLDSAC